MNKIRSRPAATALTAILLAACGGSAADQVAEDAASVQATAPPISATDPLPPGHPPVGAPAAESLIVQPPPGSGTGDAGLVWSAPEGWIQETPSSSMRRAQYRVPGPGGDGELVVFYFGPGQGGDAMANAVRWANQFAQPDGSSSESAMKTETIDVGGIAVLLTEVTGTYSGGMTMMTGASQELADHMLLGAIVQGGDANWFFKLTGPRTTLEAQQQAFRTMIESLSRGA